MTDFIVGTLVPMAATVICVWPEAITNDLDLDLENMTFPAKPGLGG